MITKQARYPLLTALQAVAKAENKKPTAAQCQEAFANLRETTVGDAPLHLIIRDAALRELPHENHPALVKSVEVKKNGKPSGLSKNQAQHVCVACFDLWNVFRRLSKPVLKNSAFPAHYGDFVNWLAPATDDDDFGDADADADDDFEDPTPETPKTVVVEASGDFIPLSTVYALSTEDDIVDRAKAIITGSENTQADGKFVRFANGKVSSFNFMKNAGQKSTPTDRQHFVNRWMNRVGMNLLGFFDSAGRVFDADGKQKNETVWLSDCSAITDDFRYDAGLVACAVVVAANIARHDMDLRGFLSPADREALASAFVDDAIADAIADFTEVKRVVRKAGFDLPMEETVVRVKPTKASSRLQRLAGL